MPSHAPRLDLACSWGPGDPVPSHLYARQQASAARPDCRTGLKGLGEARPPKGMAASGPSEAPGLGEWGGPTLEKQRQEPNGWCPCRSRWSVGQSGCGPENPSEPSSVSRALDRVSGSEPRALVFRLGWNPAHESEWGRAASKQQP